MADSPQERAPGALRIATYNVQMSRRGPGILLRDILRGKDPRIAAAAGVIAHVAPDILLLTGFDWDLRLAALGAFRDRLGAAGVRYEHMLSLRPNTGMATGLDLDRDGRTGGARDAQGFGRYPGEGGMAILSRYPFAPELRDFSAFLWKDLPGNLIPPGYYPDEVLEVLRLPTTGHWDVGVKLGGREIRLLSYLASPPVFDGPEDRNGRRNSDETRFWQLYLDGQIAGGPPPGPFVIIGDANLDPEDGDGRGDAMRDLLARPDLQDPLPQSAGGAAAATAQGGPNAAHRGPPSLDTADWSEEKGPGNLRVDYVLPSRAFKVLDAGVFWPATAGSGAQEASRHRLVWVDVRLRDD